MILTSLRIALFMFVSAAAATLAQDPPPDGTEDAAAKEKPTKPERIQIPDVQNVNELKLAPEVLSELLRGTRPHRNRAAEFEIKRRREPGDRPSPEEMRKFEEFRRGADLKSKEDSDLIDRIVRYQIYSLDDPNWSASTGKIRDDIEKMLELRGAANEKFLPLYRQLASRYLADLLDSHLWVRINAMKLLASVKDQELIRLFVDNIENPKQHEAVKYLAIEGLEILGQRRLIGKVDLEVMAVRSLLGVLRRADAVHPYTRQAAVRALGAIGRPTRVVGGNDIDVAMTLLKILRDPNIRRKDRSEALVALANLQIPPELDYNFQYVAYELGQFVIDVAEAALKNPSIDDLHSHLYLVDASYSLVADRRSDRTPLVERAKKHAKAVSHGDPAYVKIIGDQVTRLTVSGLKAYKPEEAKSGASRNEDVFAKANRIAQELKGDFASQLKSLDELLKSKPPRSMKLSPDAEELGPPPSLVGPVTESSKEPAGDSKEPQEGSRASAGNSGP